MKSICRIRRQRRGFEIQVFLNVERGLGRMVGGAGAEDGARSPHPPRNSTLPLGVPSPMYIDMQGGGEHMSNKKTRIRDATRICRLHT